LEQTKHFYAKILNCTQGRFTNRWVDFDFYGNQISAHLCQQEESGPQPTSEVDGKKVPLKHFGAILKWQEFQELAERVKQHKIPFIIEPQVRFVGLPGEQATMFFLDPSGNAIEFKAFKDENNIFTPHTEETTIKKQ